MSKKEKQVKAPKVIKVKTLLIGIVVVILAALSGLGINYLRNQSYDAGYKAGQSKASETDATVVKRVREIKSLITELK